MPIRGLAGRGARSYNAAMRPMSRPRGVRPVAAFLAVALASMPVAAQDPAPVVVGQAPAPPALPVPAAQFPAQPQPAEAVDSLTLRDGSVIRGTVAEVFQGRQVTIVSAAGQRHTIAWAQVADIRYGGQTVAPEPVAGPGRPHMHIETTRPVRLFEVSGQVFNAGPRWGHYPQAQQARPVCRAPCDRVVDGSAGQSFYFGGEGVTPSRRFTLDEHDGPLLARVKPGRAGVLVGGVLLTSLSIAPLLTGTLFLSLSQHRAPDGSHSTRDAGIVLSAVGASTLISGIVMIALGRTRVEIYRRYTGAAQRRPKPARG